ncbi:hypothetical protein [Pedobacter steynii]
MKSVLIISDTLEHYRIPMYESLCDKISLTIAHSSKINSSCRFANHSITLKKYGPFIVYENLPDLNEFDTVVFPFNPRCIQLLRYLFFKRRFKIFVFGIGVSASYNKMYDEDKKFDRIRTYILTKGEGGIFTKDILK